MIMGGNQLPSGSLPEMLRHPDWVPAHTWIFWSMAAWTVGFWSFRRSTPASLALDRWLIFAIVLSVLQTLVLGLYIMVYLDADALAMGDQAPLLDTYLRLTAIIYPVYAIALLGTIWMGQHEHVLGSNLIGWIGMLGVAGHGIAGLFVTAVDMMWTPTLFPFVMALAAWFILSGVWALRRERTSQPA